MGSRHQGALGGIHFLVTYKGILVSVVVLIAGSGLLGSASSHAGETASTEGDKVTRTASGAIPTTAWFAPLSQDVGLVSKNVKEVEFLLYESSSNPEIYTQIPFQNISGEGTPFRVNRPIKVIIHGFTEDKTTEFPKNLKNAYLEILQNILDEERFNILVIDWGKLSGAPKSLFSPLYYSEAVDNVGNVGKHIANFLTSLQDAKILRSFHDVHLIGFSLGAQVAGVVGLHVFNQSGQKVGRITGLDPAGPLFYAIPEEKGLDPSDAIFVDVLHTNGGLLGHSKILGHVDIFPNGGRSQPSCQKDWGGLCSHRLAHQLYIKSIYDPTALLACKCGSWEEFSKCSTDCEDQVKVGEPTPTTARGSYYLEVK